MKFRIYKTEIGNKTANMNTKKVIHNVNGDRDVVTMPIRDYLSIGRLILHVANQCTKFQVSSLSHSRDILGELKIFNGSRDVTTPLSGTVCRPWAGTCYDQPSLQLCICVHPLRRYKRQCKMLLYPAFPISYVN